MRCARARSWPAWGGGGGPRPAPQPGAWGGGGSGGCPGGGGAGGVLFPPVRRHGVTQMERELAMVEAEVTYASALIARTGRLFNAGAVSRQGDESGRAKAAA